MRVLHGLLQASLCTALEIELVALIVAAFDHPNVEREREA